MRRLGSEFANFLVVNYSLSGMINFTKPLLKLRNFYVRLLTRSKLEQLRCILFTLNLKIDLASFF